MPGRAPSRAHSPSVGATVPVAGNNAGSGHPVRLRPSSSQLAGHVDIRRTLPPSPLGPLSLALKRAQSEVPSGLAAQGVGAAGIATWKHTGAVPGIPGTQPAGLRVNATGVSAMRVPVTSRFH